MKSSKNCFSPGLARSLKFFQRGTGKGTVLSHRDAEMRGEEGCFCQHWPHGPPCNGRCLWGYAQALHLSNGSGSKVSWHTVGASSGTSAGHTLAWVTLSLTASLTPLPTLAAVTTNPFTFPGYDTGSSAPPVLPKACTNTASLGGTLQPRVTVMTVLAWAPVRGNLVLPGFPWLEPFCPRRTGAPLWPLLLQGCVAMPMIFLTLCSFQHVVWSGQSQHHQPVSIILELPNSWEERLVRPGWDRNFPVGLWNGETPDQHQGWLKTRSLAELLDRGTTVHLTTCHMSCTDGNFKQSWRFPMASPASTRSIHRHNLCVCCCVN